jgi:hypothetical protein
LEWEGIGGSVRASIGNKKDMGSSPCWESNRKLENEREIIQRSSHSKLFK